MVKPWRLEIMRQRDLAHNCWVGEAFWGAGGAVKEPGEHLPSACARQSKLQILEEVSNERTPVLPSTGPSGRASRSLRLFPKASEKQGNLGEVVGKAYLCNLVSPP